MYSVHNKKKSVLVERFIRTLKNKIYKYMTSTSKNVYIDKLDDIVSKYRNTYHRTIKMNPIDINPSMYIGFKKENAISGLKGKEILGRFYEKELQKTNQTVFRAKKAIKRKGDKLYVKWKDYDNSFNSWIDKKI